MESTFRKDMASLLLRAQESKGKGRSLFKKGRSLLMVRRLSIKAQLVMVVKVQSVTTNASTIMYNALCVSVATNYVCVSMATYVFSWQRMCALCFHGNHRGGRRGGG